METEEKPTQAAVIEACRITLAWALREETITDPRVRVHLEDALDLIHSAAHRDQVVNR